MASGSYRGTIRRVARIFRRAAGCCWFEPGILVAANGFCWGIALAPNWNAGGAAGAGSTIPPSPPPGGAAGPAPGTAPKLKTPLLTG